MKRDRNGISRRNVLRAGAATSIGLSAFSIAGTARADAHVRRYVPLGSTGLKMSDISFGSSALSDPELVRYAFERGVNYFDSAESYRSGSAEEAIGTALADVRDKVIITSKTKAWPRDSQTDMMRALEGSLKRLRTDYVDVYFNHAVNDVARMKNPEWHAFTERAKEQGKIRWRGLSGHGSHLVDVLNFALDNDLVDVVLAAYNFGQDPAFFKKLARTFHFVAEQPELLGALAKAKTKGVGVVAMKTLMGARLNDMREHEASGATFAQAAFKWTLTNADVDALVVSMRSREQIDEYLVASGQETFGQVDLELLERYAMLNGPGYCQQGCGACAGECPHGVEIAEVLRTRMYGVDYGDNALAARDYAAIENDATPCIGCAEQPCLGACPKGIPIASLTRQAATWLGSDV